MLLERKLLAFADPEAWFGGGVVHGVGTFVEAVLFHDGFHLASSFVQSFLRLLGANDHFVDEETDFLLDLEADRMVNSFIAKKDLDSEMTESDTHPKRGTAPPAKTVDVLPLRPPDFASKRTPSMVIALSTALHMS